MLKLVPATLYKTEIEKKFAERIYDNDMMYYNGYGFNYYVPEIKQQECRKEYACIDDDTEEVIGYFSYKIETLTKTVYNFGLYSFDKGNIGFVKLVFEELEKLTRMFHRIEWKCVCGNPAEHGYDNFCEKHNGRKLILHDCSIDDSYQIHDCAIYEIITDVKL